MELKNRKYLKKDMPLIALILLAAAVGLLFNYIQKQKSPNAADSTQNHVSQPSSANPADNNIIINGSDQQQSTMTAYLEISIDGKVTEKLDLNQNTEMTIQGYNNGTNHLVIEDGQVWIDDASCPDKICIHQGKISRNSEIIVCLPNLMIAQVRITEQTE